MPEVDLVAVLLCGVGSMVLGAVWYAPPLFGRVWQRYAGLSDEALAGGNMALIYGGAFLLDAHLHDRRRRLCRGERRERPKAQCPVHHDQPHEP